MHLYGKGLRNENLDRWLKKEGKDINLPQNLVNIMKNEYRPSNNDKKQVENLKRSQALCLMVANNAGYRNFSHRGDGNKYEHKNWVGKKEDRVR